MRKNLLFYITLSLFYSIKGYALDYSINISGNVLTSPCIINDGNPINIDFNDIPTSSVGTDKIKKEIKLAVSCGYYGALPYVKLTGNKLEGIDNVIATNIKGFGIALYQGAGTTTKLLIGEGKVTGQGGIGYRITDGISGGPGSLTFTFTAIPFSSIPDMLEAGSFSATANLSIIYS